MLVQNGENDEFYNQTKNERVAGQQNRKLKLQRNA